MAIAFKLLLPSLLNLLDCSSVDIWEGSNQYSFYYCCCFLLLIPILKKNEMMFTLKKHFFWQTKCFCSFCILQKHQTIFIIVTYAATPLPFFPLVHENKNILCFCFLSKKHHFFFVVVINNQMQYWKNEKKICFVQNNFLENPKSVFLIFCVDGETGKVVYNRRTESGGWWRMMQIRRKYWRMEKRERDLGSWCIGWGPPVFSPPRILTTLIRSGNSIRRRWSGSLIFWFCT